MWVAWRRVDSGLSASWNITGRSTIRNGLDIPALLSHRRETGSIVNFAGGENVDGAEDFFRECDVPIPAATENVITSANAARPHSL